VEPKVASMRKILREQDAQGSHVGRRLVDLSLNSVRTLTPPFPRQIQIETSNLCNHRCSFCAITQMERRRAVMDKELFRRVAAEAYALGAREIGLFAGAEPLTCKDLEEHVAYCRELGYEYQYISTNGSIGTPERYQRLVAAGLSSIKFSINAGTRESYRRVHGADDFEKVLANVEQLSAYRRAQGVSFYLGVSFVAMPDTAAEFPLLERRVAPWVDEVILSEANSQSGQVEGLPSVPFTECALPFSKLHVSLEGYVRACCNDYDNLLALDDTGTAGLAAAWHSPRFQDLRRRHIEDRLEGTLCGRCIRGDTAPSRPLNADLSPLVRLEVRRPGRPPA
jgi:wyosine [tRNA(Phe)-imidazoG37] synthetase (radical SAM superfamily)